MISLMKKREKLSKAHSKKTVRPLPDRSLVFEIRVNFLSTNRFNGTHEKERTTWYFRLECDLSGGFCAKFCYFCSMKADCSTCNSNRVRYRTSDLRLYNSGVCSPHRTATVRWTGSKEAMSLYIIRSDYFKITVVRISLRFRTGLFTGSLIFAL